ncbi:O-antigen ligase [Variovorax paradoxus]|uniref:O-antigen ligase family protein n=1 Tax=Variovorax paradoxus TaxID=34073 RepID=UPI0019312C39|nr:O-antigen ligase family protein [Variovorax paradoxus]
MIVALLFLCGTLLHSGESDSNTGWAPPALIVQIGQFSVYTAYGLLLVCFVLILFQRNFRFYGGGYFQVGMAYVFLLAIAVAHTDDLVRYLVLAITSICIPQVLLKLQKRKGHEEVILDGMQAWALMYTLISVSGFLINDAPSGRLSGYMTNPNSFGFSMVVALLVNLFIGRYSFAKKTVIGLVEFYLIHATGSRLSVLAAAIVVMYWIVARARSSKAGFAPLVFFAITVCIYLLIFQNPSEGDRGLQFASAFSDSGRDILYQQAIQGIARNPILGYGMTAHELILGTGNVHSSFLRLGFMIGLPLAAVFFLFYAYGLFSVYKMSAKGSMLRPFVMVIPLFFVGEDYIVGVGSFFYFVFLAMMGLSIRAPAEMN